jgi:hypothetical protein
MFDYTLGSGQELNGSHLPPPVEASLLTLLRHVSEEFILLKESKTIRLKFVTFGDVKFHFFGWVS